MRGRWWVVIGAAALLLAPAACGAHRAGMRVEPGKWEFRTSSNQPMGDNKERVTTRCLSENEMKPDIFRERAPKNCVISEAKTRATEMSWKMSCSKQGRTLTSDAKFTSTGDAIEGVLEMAFLFDDKQLDFERTWHGKRLGPCD